MKEYRPLEKMIRQRVEILQETIQELAQAGLVEEAATSLWMGHLGQLKDSPEDTELRVAVVGPVKSGKSTLINALAGKDLLRRGAGIITAFVTRIHTKGEVGGWVELKPWSQVLDELNDAAKMLTVADEVLEENERLDLRSGEDRQRLRLCLESMQNEWRRPEGRLDASFFLIKNYLEGYDSIRHSVGESANRLTFDEHSLPRHQGYIGHEGQATYVREVEIRYPIPWLGEKLEIADCQGSDSPNAFHLEQLQEYMLSSHFILYVINSRTGLRDADFKLLDFIKKLRMFPQTFFILNVDLDDHPDKEDLDRLIERVRTELGWMVPDPQLYAFSALYHLMVQRQEELPARDRRHLEIWRGEGELAEHMERGLSEFQDHLSQRISAQRNRVLLDSGLSRLTMVAGNVLDTVSVQKGFMGGAPGSITEAVGQLKSKQMALQATLGTLANAISGLKDSLLHELAQAVDHYFDLNDGPVIQETLEMVDHYPVDPEYKKNLADYHQLVSQLYRFYLEFRQSLARYLVEKVNTRIIEFAKDQEVFLQERLNQSAQAFWSLFTTAVSDYRRQIAPYNVEFHTADGICTWEWFSGESTVPPTFSAFVGKEALGRGVLLMKFGLGRFSGFLVDLTSRLGKRKGLSALEEESQRDDRIEEAIKLVKSETKSELLEAFVCYKRRFERGYLQGVLDAGITHLLREFEDRTQLAHLDFENLLRQSEVQGDQRQSQLEILTRASQMTQAMVEELDELTCAVDLG